MAKRKRQRLKHYRHNVYSRSQQLKKGAALLALVAAVLVAAWLAAPYVLDWGTHTWYTLVRAKDLSASEVASESGTQEEPAATEAPAATPTPTPTATPTPEATPEATQLPGTAIREGSWASVSLSALGSAEAITAQAEQLAAQGVQYALVTLKDTSGYIYYSSEVPAAASSIAATVVDPAAIAAAFREAGVTPVAWLAAFRDPVTPYTNRSFAIHYGNGEYLWLDASSAAAGGKPWLNPYSDEAVQYIGDLIDEVYAFGFEQVVLGNVQFPEVVSAKQEFGVTGGRTRAEQLEADIAVWAARFEGRVTLWYEYPLSSCQTADATTEVLPPELGCANLVVRLPADEVTDEETVEAVAEQMKELGAAYVAVRDGKTASLR
jgi:hypothetical protein